MMKFNIRPARFDTAEPDCEEFRDIHDVVRATIWVLALTGSFAAFVVVVRVFSLVPSCFPLN
jgi:hypothetical protein